MAGVTLARSAVGNEASESDKKAMLDILERVGKKIQPLELKETFKNIPNEIKSDKEKLSRFLLLTAILDQQAKSPTARSTAIEILNILGDDLFNNPKSSLLQLNKLYAIKDGYKISSMRIPRFGFFVLRVGGFLIYEMMLNNNSLVEKLREASTPRDAINFLHSNKLLESILRDKAAYMYISWVGHPDLGIDISEGKWDKSSFLMPVDGHVGKIFSRTGIVDEVIHERLRGKSDRWNIISASQMRPKIQEVVSSYGNDTIMVDHGAFQVGFNCCTDNLEGICCDKCSKLYCKVSESIDYPDRCVLSEFCKRNLIWRAY